MATAFEQASWLASFATLFLLIYWATYRPSVLVKPSYLVAAALHCTIQWSSTWNATWIEKSIRHTWDYFFLVQAFPLVLALCSGLFFSESARRISHLVTSVDFRALLPSPRVYWVTGALCAFILICYFSQLDWTQTGLYSVFFAPEASALARERSYKLLESQSLKYAYSLLSTTIAPLLSVFLGLKVVSSVRDRSWATFTFSGLAIVGLIFAVSVSGARSPSAMLALVVLYAGVVRRGSIPNPALLPLVAVVLFSGPALISLWSSGEVLSWTSFQFHFLNVLDRAFGRGIVDGIWHFQYVERFGFFGWAGLGNFATLLGESPVNTFNLVGRSFSPTMIDSVSANTAYTIAYYSCFGSLVFLPCLVATLLLDSILVFASKLDRTLVLPCVAASGIAATNLNATFFTTVLVTFGFVLIPFFCWVLQAALLEKGQPKSVFSSPRLS